MCRKYFFSLLSLVINLLCAFALQAQTQLSETESKNLLHKIDESLGKIKTIVYKIDFDKKYLSENDTIHTIALCSLYMSPKDRMKAYSIVDFEYTRLNQRSYGHRRYDGKKTFQMNYAIDSLEVYKKPFIDKSRKMTESVVNEYRDLLLPEYLLEEKTFDRWQDFIKDILIIEDNYNNREVYVIVTSYKFKQEGIEGIVEAVDKHVIGKSDYLPVVFTSTKKWEGMEQYNRYEIEYLAVNPDIPLAIFEVNKNESINPGERYRVLKEKAGIKN